MFENFCLFVPSKKLHDLRIFNILFRYLLYKLLVFRNVLQVGHKDDHYVILMKAKLFADYIVYFDAGFRSSNITKHLLFSIEIFKYLIYITCYFIRKLK